MKTFLLCAAVAAACLGLAGCFGGSSGDDGPGPLEEVPGSASASVSGFIAYLKELVALQPEDVEPVGIDGVTPPQPDTTEPEPVT